MEEDGVVLRLGEERWFALAGKHWSLRTGLQRLGWEIRGPLGEELDRADFRGQIIGFRSLVPPSPSPSLSSTYQSISSLSPSQTGPHTASVSFTPLPIELPASGTPRRLTPWKKPSWLIPSIVFIKALKYFSVVCVGISASSRPSGASFGRWCFWKSSGAGMWDSDPPRGPVPRRTQPGLSQRPAPQCGQGVAQRWSHSQWKAHKYCYLFP